MRRTSAQLQDIQDEMEDMLEQTNEVMDVLGRPYGLPEDVDEDDLEAGRPVCMCLSSLCVRVHACVWMCG